MPVNIQVISTRKSVLKTLFTLTAKVKEVLFVSERKGISRYIPIPSTTEKMCCVVLREENTIK